jgi:ethanolamine ammonia-lyase small subunit
MNDRNLSSDPPPREAEALAALRARTPARILTGRAGVSYRTGTQLRLREDHAFALDAVHAEVDPLHDFGLGFHEEFRLLEVQTRASHKQQYLMRPDLGRQFDDDSRAAVTANCPRGVDLQVVIGDGLSAAAVVAHAPLLCVLLARGAQEKGWGFGRPFFVRYCRVGVLNDIGELLEPSVVVLLIGERPGLATAESLSAYLAYQPRAGHTDAQRNLISNVHSRGVSPEEAARRVLALAEKMRQMQTSGVAVKEDLPGLVPLTSGG